jgi:hypothetical protein
VRLEDVILKSAANGKKCDLKVVLT